MRRAVRASLALLATLAAAPLAAQRAEAPIALSDPNGQELVVEELNVRTAVEGVFSLTELEIVFRNPHARRMEGRFSATLPEGATVSRFAKEVNGRLMEGEVVERLRATRVYAEILHQLRDPALLEHDQGNRFTARIFPIEANARVRVVLGYTRLLRMEGGERVYRVPLRGLPRIGVMRMTANVSALPTERLESSTFPHGAASRDLGMMSWSDESFTPTEDLEFRWRPAADAPRTYLLRAGDYYLAAVRPDVAPRRTMPVSRWMFLIDTSASSAEGMEHRIAALRTILSALPEGRVELVAFDQEVRELGQFTTREAAARVGDLLRARRFLGGTDLNAALRFVTEHAVEDGRARVMRPELRYVLVTDGAATMGALNPAERYGPLNGLPAGTSLSALVLGAREDGRALRTVTQGRGRIVRVPFTDRMEERAREAAAQLARPRGGTLDVRDPSADVLHADGADDVLPGGEVLVLGRLRGARAPRLTVGGVLVGNAAALPEERFAPLLVREFYRAHLDSLQAEERYADGDEGRRRMAQDQVDLSVKYRVMIPRTTMLVLETEEDYERFGLDRRALADILTVGPAGIERLDRPAGWLLAQVDTAFGRELDESATSPDALRDDVGNPGGDEAARAESNAGAPPPPPPPPMAPPPPAPVNAQTQAPLLREDVVVTGAATDTIMTGPGLAPPPSAQRAIPEWATARRFRPGEVDSLRAALRANPRDRSLYNALSEALAEAGEWAELRDVALRWQPLDPDNPQVYESLALAFSGLGEREAARRAVGSLADVAASNAEMLQRAALLLLRLGEGQAAEAPAMRAVELRPDLPNPYRTLALVRWQVGSPAGAAQALEEALSHPVDRWYGNAAQVVREELGYVYRDWMRAEPARAEEIRRRAAERFVDLARTDRLRVTMWWDTDGNDVDLHVVDPKGAHVYYAQPTAPSGLRLLQDITQGYGPEVIRTDSVLPGEYHVGVKYYNAGPMGISRGIVVVMERAGDSTRVRIEPFRLLPERGDVQRVLTISTIAER